MSDQAILNEPADTIEAANTDTAWKTAFAKSMRVGDIDLQSLDAIGREARRVLNACEKINAFIAAKQGRVK